MNPTTNFSTEFLEEVTHGDTTRTFIKSLVRDAVKFRLPTNGVVIDVADIFNENFKADFEKNPELANRTKSLENIFKDLLPIAKLPFDKVVLEFYEDYEAQNTKMIVLLEQVEDFIIVDYIFKDQNMAGKSWIVSPVQAVYKDFHFFLRNTPDIAKNDAINQPGYREYFNRKFGMVVYTTLAFLASLSCSNVSAEDLPTPKMLNKKRVAKGLNPYFTYKTLVIEANRQAKSNNKKIANGSHASPREHLRRGHIRRLGEKRIWVNSCVVNAQTEGKVQKQYMVRK